MSKQRDSRGRYTTRYVASLSGGALMGDALRVTPDDVAPLADIMFEHLPVSEEAATHLARKIVSSVADLPISDVIDGLGDQLGKFADYEGGGYLSDLLRQAGQGAHQIVKAVIPVAQQVAQHAAGQYAAQVAAQLAQQHAKQVPHLSRQQAAERRGELADERDEQRDEQDYEAAEQREFADQQRFRKPRTSARSRKNLGGAMLGETPGGGGTLVGGARALVRGRAPALVRGGEPALVRGGAPLGGAPLGGARRRGGGLLSFLGL